MNTENSNCPIRLYYSAVKVIFVIMALIISIESQANATDSHRGHSCDDCSYSNAASAFCPKQQITERKEFLSPDGLKKIIVKTKPMEQPELYVDIGKHEYRVNFSPWPCPEFQWSPDSAAFFVTYSDGGAVGNFEVRVYYPSEKGITMINPTRLVQTDFLKHYPKCFDPEIPNLAGIAWITSSKRLLIAAQVLPDSNCDMMGTFSAYEIQVPSGKIIKKYTQLEAKKSFWDLLGPELRNADDECFTNPGDCQIPMLHGK